MFAMGGGRDESAEGEEGNAGGKPQGTVPPCMAVPAEGSGPGACSRGLRHGRWRVGFFLFSPIQGIPNKLSCHHFSADTQEGIIQTVM